MAKSKRKAGDWLMMYHVTPAKNLDSIKKHGLICKIGPRSQKIGEPISAIYLFPNLIDFEHIVTC